MVSLPWAIVIALATALVSGAVAWGAMGARIAQLKELVEKVEARLAHIDQLRVDVTRVQSELASGKERVIALEHWRNSHQSTGPYPKAPA